VRFAINEVTVNIKYQPNTFNLMSLFNFFKKKQNGSSTEDALINGHLPPIPEDIFVEKDTVQDWTAPVNSFTGINAIYSYLQSDFESKGFNDALTSPDDKYKEDNLRLIKFDLEIIISKVKTYHESFLKELEFHVSSRKRSGLIDLVEELLSKKEDLENHIKKVEQIEESLKTDSGLFERAILAYNRGFTKGLASITQRTLLSKEF
jgi:hypothetical protein